MLLFKHVATSKVMEERYQVSIQSFFQGWLSRWGYYSEVRVSQVFEYADKDFPIWGTTDRARQVSLGKFLRKNEDNVQMGFCLTPTRKVHNAQLWQLMPMESVSQ